MNGKIFSRVCLGFQILLGLVYFVLGGLNGFLRFMPPEPMEEKAAALMEGIFASGYLMMLLKLTELIGGALLVVSIFPRFALLALAPVTLNVFLFHIFTAGSGIPVAAAILVAHLLAAYRYRDDYAAMFKLR